MTDPRHTPQTPDEETAATGSSPACRPPFEQVYEEHFTYIWHLLRRLGVWERDLEDSAHDVFVVVYRHLDKYDPERPLRPWLAGIAYRVASDFRRRALHRRQSLDDTVEATDERPLADAVVAEHEARALVYRALEQVDLDQRAVFVLHDLEGLTMPEIAAALEVGLNTCYSRLRLAREAFEKTVRRIRLRQGETG